jgi:hypothetical protein
MVLGELGGNPVEETNRTRGAIRVAPELETAAGIPESARREHKAHTGSEEPNTFATVSLDTP